MAEVVRKPDFYVREMHNIKRYIRPGAGARRCAMRLSQTIASELLLNPDGVDRLVRETSADRAFVELIQAANISLIAALRPGAVARFGAKDGALTVSSTPMARPLGLAADGSRLAIATQREIVVFVPSYRLAPQCPWAAWTF
jgi:hypothetical protein